MQAESADVSPESLKLYRQENVVSATSRLSPLRDSSARQTFPSGFPPAVKDSFGLHGHYAFGSVAKKKSGVGGKSATSVGLTTDLVHWLHAGKTVDVVRFASKIHRLASAFRTASVASLPAAIHSRPPCGG